MGDVFADGRAISRVIALLAEDEESCARELGAASAELPAELRAGVERIAQTMAKLRRRDRELSALIDSTRRLVAVRDTHDLLQELVDRAHDLMGTDITYLSEYAPATDELFVRATHGAVSTAMRELRVPSGVGLVSQVVKHRKPMWTTSYYADRRVAFNRAGMIDDAINAEQMRSLLGVPLISGDRVLGVLFAADRYERTFSDDEIALLSALADHGAVILQTAHLLEAERAAKQASVNAETEARRRAQASETSAAVHEQLTRLVLTGEGIGQVALMLSTVLERPMAIANRELDLTAATSGAARGWWIDGRLTDDIASAIDLSRATGHWAAVPGAGGPRLPESVVAAMAGPQLLGAILVGIGAEPLDDMERRTVERAAQIVALVTMQQDAMATAEERVRGELVGDLLSGRGDLGSLRGRAHSRGVDLDQDWVIVFAQLPDQQRWTLTRTLAESESRWLVGNHGGGVVVLVPGRDPSTSAEQVHRRLGEITRGPAVVVAASGAVEPAALAGEAGTVVACAGLLGTIGVTDAAVTVDAYAPYLAMFGPDASRTIGFVDQTLGPLLAWDREHGTELARTLEAYLSAKVSITRAAQALYVHPNTVKQRLERITLLLGEHWRDSEPLFRIGVALRLHALRPTTQR